MILSRNRPSTAKTLELLRPDEQLQPPAEIRVRRDVEIRLRHERLPTEASEPILHIGCISDFAGLAVADHIDPNGDLTSNDIGNRLANLRSEFARIVRLVAITLDEQFHQRLRPRQAADMRSENAISAEFHGALLNAT